MMPWIFISITLSAALIATFVRHMRRAILALWVASLGIGALYLTIGAEFLAIVQWVMSTLTTISFIFFSVLFGEYNTPPGRAGRKDMLRILLSIVLGCGFTAVIWLGSRSLPEGTLLFSNRAADVSVLGRTLTQEHLLSLEVLALTLFLVLVGGGVVARSEGSDSP